MSGAAGGGDWFPADIAFALLRPGDLADDPLPAERALLAPQALPERVAEFARGRAAARQALRALGVPEAERYAVLRQGLRAPRWPEPVVGAISHSGDWAAAAAAWRRDFLGIGLDLERIRTVKPQLIARIALPEERAWLDALPGAQRALGFALLFSAKESIYKALHPATGVFLGYADAVVVASPPRLGTIPPPRQVEIGPGGGDEAGTFRWRLRRASGERFPVGYEGEGRWQNFGEVVATAIWVRA